MNVEVDANVENWEPWVRAAVIEFELLSHLHFSIGADNYNHPVTNAVTLGTDWAMLWHTEFVDPARNPIPTAPTATPAATCKPLVSMLRPDKAIFDLQVSFMEQYADLREDRASEILSQLGPQFAFWGSIVYLHPDRTKWTIELLGTALRLAHYAEQRFKHALACRRPLEYSPQVQPMILTPGHGTLPSGHSTEAHIVAYVLWKLLQASGVARNSEWLEQLMRQAARIAINRTIAGVHFPVDSAAGQLLGLTLGEYFVHRCNNAVLANYTPWRFVGMRYDGTRDFAWRDQYDAAADAHIAAPFTNSLAGATAQQSGLLNWLWGRATQEITRNLL